MTGEFVDRRVVVMGLGRFGGGVGVAQWLARQGARVVVTDQADPATLGESIARLDGLGIQFRCGRHAPSDLDGADLLVVSPAVDQRTSEFVSDARRRHIPITSEMNLFFERCRGRIVGVTGTVGKSTTCAMLDAILQRAVRQGELGASQVWFGGNIGRSLLGELEAIGAQDLVVLELSSFQLEDLAVLKKSPPMAVILNIVPKHLDRHGSFDDYQHCKLNICRYQCPGDLVVLGSDDPSLLGSVTELTGRTEARVVVAKDDAAIRLRILGPHNRRNAAVAARVAALLEVGRGTAVEALADFGGLPHRVQFIRETGGASYYNDSKATSPEAVAAALSCFDQAVVLIVGGQERGESWEPVLAQRRHKIRHAICMGESGRALADVLDGTAVSTLQEAVAEAYGRAGPGDVVLFSPGCPSYDQFVNYEARGEAFVRLVRAL